MKDRGLKKWNGFFIPQHISMLKKFEIEDMKVQKPVLDEDQLHQINDILVESLMDREQIQLKLWLDGMIEEFGPFIATKIDPYQGKLYGLYQDDICSYSFDSIIGAKRL
ncbi:YolD-like family protein [Bacillus andreraoultii]|uniref:YolD-like family protein n=1 Tax=Bacillus andreraoultii TaxID=1499685 RepID=UPI00067F6251|nr:YolD-like family protein [Bacillus andreraoultii]